MNWILKIAKDYEGNNIWQALYYNGNRLIENFTLDKSILVDTFLIPSIDDIKELEMAENDDNNLSELFPFYEDFSYLEEEILQIYPGQTIWLPEIKGVISGGWAIVSEVCDGVELFQSTYKNILLSEENQKNGWFISCKDIPTIFSWNILEKIQPDLKSRYGYEIKAEKNS